jgi:hypothetical protein
MKYIKFILVHVLLDIFFLVAMTYLYFRGASGSLLLRNLPLWFICAFAIFVCVKNVKYKGLFEAIGECALFIGMFMWYQYATAHDYDVLASSMPFMKFVRSVILVICFFLILDIIKSYLMSFIKSAQIFYLAQDEDITILDSFFGAVKRFKFTFAIPIFNTIIRSCIGEVLQFIQNHSKKKDDEDTAEKDDNGFMELLGDIGDSGLGKLTKKALKLYTSYADECVQLYCYRHPEQSMFKSTLQALSIFFKNCIQIIKAMSAIVILQVIIKIVLGVCAIAVIISYHAFSFSQMLIVYLMIKILDFVIADAVIEPLMLQKILLAFNKFSYEYDSFEAILSKFPVLNKIKKLQGIAEPDDLEQPMENTPEDQLDETTKQGEMGDQEDESHRNTEERKKESYL